MRNEEECIVLLDNGSLRPESTLRLRKLASELGKALGETVHPVSLLHSSKVPSDSLGGIEAETWRRFLRQRLEAGVSRVRLVPLFFGPSSAISDYLPKVTSEVVGSLGRGRVLVAKTLLDPTAPEEDSVAVLLRDLVIQQLDTLLDDGLAQGVVLVDHGSPLASVAACRDRVAGQLGELLASRRLPVVAASMERREGDEYAFNEPLLESALEQARLLGWQRLLLSYLFFSPGRHAGPGGDIDEIVAKSRFVREGGVVLSMPLVGESPQLVDLLVRRYRESFGV